MVSFFQRLGDTAISANCRFRVIFSSRHYPHITVSRGLSLTLERQAGHSNDIVAFIKTELKLGRSSLEEKIRSQLLVKSSGIFMWVVLVVSILNKEHDTGRSARHLQRRLESLPSSLYELFRDILKRDNHNRDELIVCFQWVLYARRPLAPEELYLAILCHTDPEDVLSDIVSVDSMMRFILNCSKGLAEVTKATDKAKSVVQFIHESVRDFLLKENGLKALFPDVFRGNIDAESHDRLTQGCFTYLNIKSRVTITCPQTSRPRLAPHQVGWGSSPSIRSTNVAPSPENLLDYSVKYMLTHAEEADSSGYSQRELISALNRRDWLELYSRLAKTVQCSTKTVDSFLRPQVDFIEYTARPTLEYILAVNNCGSLLRTLASHTSCFEVGDEQFGPPILAALATQSPGAVEALLELEANRYPEFPVLKDLAKQYKLHVSNRPEKQEGHRKIFAGTFRFNPDLDNFSHVVEFGEESLVNWFLTRHPVAAHSTDCQGLTPLFRAAQGGHTAIVQLLMDKYQVEVEYRDAVGRTALSYAVEVERWNVVEFLLEKGADIETRDAEGLTPLAWAAKSEYAMATEKLLAFGSQINASDNKGMTPLLLASRAGRESAVKLLLANCLVDKDAVDHTGKTALKWAVDQRHSKVVKLLAQEGRVDLNRADNNHQTPLMTAVMRCSWTDVDILFWAGADLHLRDQNGNTFLDLALKLNSWWLKPFLTEKSVEIDLDTGDTIQELCVARERAAEDLDMVGSGR